jgi:hypothetical protein
MKLFEIFIAPFRDSPERLRELRVVARWELNLRNLTWQTTITKTELHENAPKPHRAAAEQHGKGDHAKGMEHSKCAQQHSQSANKQSDQDHAKSQQQK